VALLIGIGGFVPRSRPPFKTFCLLTGGHMTSCSCCTGHGVARMTGLFLVACSWISWLDICARLAAMCASERAVSIRCHTWCEFCGFLINFFRSVEVWWWLIWLAVSRLRFFTTGLPVYSFNSFHSDFLRFTMLTFCFSDSMGWSMSCVVRSFCS